MKSFKLFLLVLCIGLIIPLQINAQLYWQTTGNTPNPNNFLGSTNNQVLNFKTNNLYRMRLMNNSGYLGIGSQSFTPSAMLHLNQLSYSIKSGNLIRTDGRSNSILTWTMYSGTSVGNSVQKARFLLSPSIATQNNSWNTNMVNASVNHLQIESTLGDIVFEAQGANSSQETGELAERMRVTSMLYRDPHWGPNPVSTTRVSISAKPKRPVTEPLAMLHIGEPWHYQLGGHREWMNTGMYANRDNDNVFFGMRPREKTTNSDANDAIIAWGDNDSPPGREDGLRVVFCAPYTGSANPGEAGHLNGLETMRFHPLGNIGMGDFSVNGLNQTPTEKLDIVGKLRIRDVPDNLNPDVLIVGYEVDSVGDYVLNHLPFPADDTQFLSGTGEWIEISGIGGEDCRWSNTGSSTVPGETDMFTAFDPINEECYRGKVGIGVKDPNDGKLEVWMINNLGNIRNDEILTATYSRATVWQNGAEVMGINGVADCAGQLGSGQLNIGVNGIGTDSRYVCGVRGQGKGVTNGTGISIGVWGDAHNGQNANIGVYGTSSQSGFAGYFTGPVVMNQTPLIFSDESLKVEVNSIDNATSLLNQLAPKTYYFQTSESNPIPFPEDMQFGLIAQQVQSIIPDIVHETLILPAQDSTGFIEDSEIKVLGIEYDQLIPILIAGFQEQNSIVTDQSSIIATQTEQIAEMETQLVAQELELQAIQNQMSDILEAIQAMQAITANCCTAESGNGATGDLNNGSKAEPELEQNIPNPFDNNTLIAFSLPKPAQVILEITDATGRPIERLIDEQMSNGKHSIIWNGSKVASGIYFYTLYADGQLITKKMIKR